MWLKSALQEHCGIIREGHCGHVDKTVDEFLNRIILSDCAEYYSSKMNFGFYRNTSPKASMKIDYDNNVVDVKILMKVQLVLHSDIIKMKF
jgi:hypothetical protein